MVGGTAIVVQGEGIHIHADTLSHDVMMKGERLQWVNSAKILCVCVCVCVLGQSSRGKSHSWCTVYTHTVH